MGPRHRLGDNPSLACTRDDGNGRITNAKPALQSSNQQHYDHSSEDYGGRIHNVVIGFAPKLCVPSHLNNQLNDKWPAQ
jgi:hypothetical protein